MTEAHMQTPEKRLSACGSFYMSMKAAKSKNSKSAIDSITVVEFIMKVNNYTLG